MKCVKIYTDGACSGNPGRGGWGVVLKYGSAVKEISGCDDATTNNRMELMAAIQALYALREPCEVVLTTDSQYLVNGIEKGWAKDWKANGWRKSNKKPAQNSDLWDELLSLLEVHTVKFMWIKGHNGHPENERCDQLAVEACLNIKK